MHVLQNFSPLEAEILREEDAEGANAAERMVAGNSTAVLVPGGYRVLGSS